MGSTNQSKIGYLAVGTSTTPTFPLDVAGVLRVGSFSSAPTGANGAIYYDTTAGAFKGYKASAWADLGGTASVSSVFNRTGAIVATTGDYTVSNITGAAPLASPTFTGTPAAPTAAAGTNTTQLATTAFATTADNLKANLASPTFTGTVTMGGALAMGNNKITGLATPTVATDAATMGYVDTKMLSCTYTQKDTGTWSGDSICGEAASFCVDLITCYSLSTARPCSLSNDCALQTCCKAKCCRFI